MAALAVGGGGPGLPPTTPAQLLATTVAELLANLPADGVISGRVVGQVSGSAEQAPEAATLWQVLVRGRLLTAESTVPLVPDTVVRFQVTPGHGDIPPRLRLITPDAATATVDDGAAAVLHRLGLPISESTVALVAAFRRSGAPLTALPMAASVLQAASAAEADEAADEPLPLADHAPRLPVASPQTRGAMPQATGTMPRVAPTTPPVTGTGLPLAAARSVASAPPTTTARPAASGPTTAAAPPTAPEPAPAGGSVAPSTPVRQSAITSAGFLAAAPPMAAERPPAPETSPRTDASTARPSRAAVTTASGTTASGTTASGIVTPGTRAASAAAMVSTPAVNAAPAVRPASPTSWSTAPPFPSTTGPSTTAPGPLGGESAAVLRELPPAQRAVVLARLAASDLPITPALIAVAAHATVATTRGAPLVGPPPGGAHAASDPRSASVPSANPSGSAPTSIEPTRAVDVPATSREAESRPSFVGARTSISQTGSESGNRPTTIANPPVGPIDHEQPATSLSTMRGPPVPRVPSPLAGVPAPPVVRTATEIRSVTGQRDVPGANTAAEVVPPAGEAAAVPGSVRTSPGLATSGPVVTAAITRPTHAASDQAPTTPVAARASPMTSARAITAPGAAFPDAAIAAPGNAAPGSLAPTPPSASATGSIAIPTVDNAGPPPTRPAGSVVPPLMATIAPAIATIAPSSSSPPGPAAAIIAPDIPDTPASRLTGSGAAAAASPAPRGPSSTTPVAATALAAPVSPVPAVEPGDDRLGSAPLLARAAAQRAVPDAGAMPIRVHDATADAATAAQPGGAPPARSSLGRLIQHLFLEAGTPIAPGTLADSILDPELGGAEAVRRALRMIGISPRGAATEVPAAEPPSSGDVPPRHRTPATAVAPAASATAPAWNPAQAVEGAPDRAVDPTTPVAVTPTPSGDGAPTWRSVAADLLLPPPQLSDYDQVFPLPFTHQGLPAPARLAVSTRRTADGRQAAFLRVDGELSVLGPVSVRLSGVERGPVAITVLASPRGSRLLLAMAPGLTEALKHLGLTATVRVVEADPASP